jgi:serine/threonine protein kinase/tetratricopeptide (TPR) repeat protein
MALATSTRLGPYEIVAKLGAGGMGEVYRARDTRLERDVAVKVLPEATAHEPQALARLQREAKAVAALSHPNLVVLYDIGADNGLTYVVMELLEGHTLGARLKQSPLDLAETLRIATGVADGLAVAHAKGIIHRDIKPENIFLTSGGGVKVLDFGLARLQPGLLGPGSPASVTLETKPGVLMGTVAYMAPEQIRGQQVDPSADVFAFGCVLFEMLAHRRPFEGQSGADIMAAILNDPPPALSASGRQRPAEVDRLILRCLEKSPANRFPSARELAAGLREIAARVALDDSRQRHTETVAFHADDTASAKRGTAGGPSVAVLPFVNMSSDPENEFFSDGLAEELINALTKIEGLRVASRTSAFAFKGKQENIRRIGEELHVRTVLEGSVRKSGHRLRIAAQLVNVADGYHLWSATYNRQMEDVFEIQDEIAHAITKALRVILTEKDEKALEKAQGPTSDVRAYEQYLRGRQFFHQFRRKGFEFAQRMFAQAIEIDPTYARAYAGMADCYSFLYLNWEATPANLQHADTASRIALELDEDLAEAHVSRGFALTLKKRFDEARQQFETAIRLDPTLFEARYFYGRACLAQGKLEEAAQHFEEACGMRPEDYQAASHLASIYGGLGRKEQSLAACHRCLHVIEKHRRMHPDDARALYLGAVVWGQLGDSARALDWAGQALAIDPEEPVTLYNVACMYSLQGKVEQALDCLENAVKHGFAHRAWIEHDTDLNALHGHPRYQALLERLQSPTA